MKCKCGENFIMRRVDIKRKRNYRVTTYRCDSCQIEFYLGRIFVHK